MNDINLTSKQSTTWKYLMDDTTCEILYGGSAGGGKSFLGCLWILSCCLQYPGTRWLIGRSKLVNLRLTTLKTFFEVASGCKLIADKHFKYNAQSNIIKFNNGSEIILKDLDHYPSDPNFDSLGSLEISGAFIDECNQITEKAKSIVFSRIRYKLDEFNLRSKILMTCNPAKNWVYNSFYKPSIDNNLSEDKKFIQALVTDNEYINKQYIENLSKLDNQSKQRLLYGNWDYQDEDYLIPFEKLSYSFKGRLDVKSITHLSIDVARFGKDSTTIIMWDNLDIVNIIKYNKKSIKESYDIISDLIKRYNIDEYNIIVDSDGVGGGLSDFLSGTKQFINNAKAISGENYQNLKTQCYYKLIELINSESIRIYNIDPEIRLFIEQELQVLKRKNVEKDGRIEILSKDDVKKQIGRSPDISDAMMMRMWYEVSKSGQFDYDFVAF